MRYRIICKQFMSSTRQVSIVELDVEADDFQEGPGGALILIVDGTAVWGRPNGAWLQIQAVDPNDNSNNDSGEPGPLIVTP